MTDGRNDLLTEGMTESPSVVIAQPKGCAIRKENKRLLELFEHPKINKEIFENIFHPFSWIRGTYRTIIIFDSGSHFIAVFLDCILLLDQLTYLV